MRRRPSIVLVCVGCLVSGCWAGSEPLRARTGNAWTDCYRRFEPGGDAAADLAALGQACAAPAGMHAIATHQGAEQTAGGPAERLVWKAHRGCYRAFAVGALGVSDLDLAVYDPSGQIAGGDVSRDRWPIVPPRGPLCVETEGDYTVAISVARGKGDFLLQIWGTD